MISDNQTINYNKDIVLTIDGVDVVVVQCFCTIVANRSINYFIEIVNSPVYKANKALVQTEVNKYKADCERIAKEYRVPTYK